MKLTFVTEQSLNEAWEERLKEIGEQDVLVFGFNGLGLVSYKKELCGETEYFQDIARLSKQLSNVVISGCDTDTYGVFRHSVVIAEKGKILGVSDMAHSFEDSEFVAGGNYRVYQTSVGRIGLIVGEDLYFSESSNALSLCDADLIICVFKRLESNMPQLLIRANAFVNGVPFGLCADKYTAVSDIRGNIVCASSQNIVQTKVLLEREYHDISIKRRFHKVNGCDY